MKNIKLDKYQKKICLKRDISCNKELAFRKFDFAVVIPVYGEYDYIDKTIVSLLNNNLLLLNKTLILLVINNPSENPNKNYVAQNQRLLKELIDKSYFNKHSLNKLNLAWIDASSGGIELPGKGGVGMARKLGMDSVLMYLNWKSEPLIFCLDSDTIVEENYLSAVNEYFEKYNDITAASVNFKHLSGETSEEEKAIREYEFSIRYYVENLKKAGSPYAYYTIGSAMVSRADAYVRAGGMRLNRGGEDFYFMQQLRKLGKIGEIHETTVYQSARPSDRVPFGTGPKVQRCINGYDIKLYNPKIFEALKEVISNAENWISDGDVSKPENFIKSIDKDSGSYFLSLQFGIVWCKILNNNIKCINTISKSEIKKLIKAFHVWFDAFKTLKFVHFLERNYPEKYHKVRNTIWNR